MSYVTGTDMEVFLGPPALQFDEDLTRFERLDVTSVSIIEEGDVLPLYNYFDYTPHQGAFATRLVSGALHFNFSQAHLDLMRSGPVRDGLHTLRGDTLYVELRKIDYAADLGGGRIGARALRELVRIDQVWEHPFQHVPDPSAAEIVSFSAHSMTLVERQQADVPAEGAIAFVKDPAQFHTSAYIPTPQRQYFGTVESVLSGDTFLVKLDKTDETITVRLSVASAPKTNGKNEPARWRWPQLVANPDGSLHVNAGAEPSAEQLSAWGDCVVEQAEAWLAERNHRVILAADPYTQPQDEPTKRTDAELFFHGDTAEAPQYFFNLRSTKGEDFELWLLENGYATPGTNATGQILTPEGELMNRRRYYGDVYRKAKSNAGTPEAKGLWASFDAPCQST